MTSSAAAIAPGAEPLPLPHVVAAALAALPTLAAAYLPTADVRPLRREVVLARGAACEGAPAAAWVHRTWADFLGADVGDHLDAALAVEAGDLGVLDDLPPEQARRLVDAAVAAGRLAAHVERSAARLAGPTLNLLRPSAVARAASDVATVLAAAPVAVPSLVAGAVLHATNLLLPPAPTVEMPDEEPNLLAALVAETIPSYLRNAAVRGLLLRLPKPVTLGIESGALGATVAVGAGRVVVSNGVAPQVWAVIGGDMASLAAAGSKALAREMSRPLR